MIQNWEFLDVGWVRRRGRYEQEAGCRGRNLGLQRHGGSPRYGLLLIKQITLDQLLEELIPVQLTNHGAGIVIIRNIGGVFC